MRGISLIGCVLVAGLLVAAVLFGWRRTSSQVTNQKQTVAAASSLETVTEPTPNLEPESTNSAASLSPERAPSPTDLTLTSEPTPNSHQAYVAKRTAELQDLSAENDAGSLEVILSELTNRDREIRKAAIEAAIQFGSRDAIPRLLEAAGQTDDQAEKAEFQEAADYLKLPSLTEVLAQKKTPVKIPAQPPRHNIPSKKQPPIQTP